MMKCEDAVKILHESEGKRIEEMAAGVHVFFCASCRKSLPVLKEAESELSSYAPYPLPRDFTDDIMARVSSLSAHELRDSSRIPLFGWVAVGMVLLASMYALTLSVTHTWLKGQLGSSLEIPLNIAMGIIITAYAALFIGSHLDDFTARFGVRR